MGKNDPQSPREGDRDAREGRYSQQPPSPREHRGRGIGGAMLRSRDGRGCHPARMCAAPGFRSSREFSGVVNNLETPSKGERRS